MREMKAGEFKAKCLKVMDEVQATGEPVLITKRGKPVARLVAEPPLNDGSAIKFLRDTVAIADPDDDLTETFSQVELDAFERHFLEEADEFFGPIPAGRTPEATD